MNIIRWVEYTYTTSICLCTAPVPTRIYSFNNNVSIKDKSHPSFLIERDPKGLLINIVHVNWSVAVSFACASIFISSPFSSTYIACFARLVKACSTFFLLYLIFPYTPLLLYTSSFIHLFLYTSFLIYLFPSPPSPSLLLQTAKKRIEEKHSTGNNSTRYTRTGRDKTWHHRT